MGIMISDFLKIPDPKVIDIRPTQKYNDNHIPNSINVEYSKLVGNPEKYINKNDTYYIYCQKGVLSKRTVIFLRSMGYNVIDIIGGYEGYILNNYNNY